MKSNVTKQKMSYLQPICTFVNVQEESHLLVMSAETTDPTEGGDPTGGDNSTPNPFASSSAKMQWFTEE
jgi:conserved domain protein